MSTRQACLVLLLLLFSEELMAQHNLEKDTFKLQEIELIGIRNKEKNLLKTISLDSSLMADHQSGTLADLLSNSSICIKNYGPSMSAIPSFRGTAGDHTKIYWNGIPINSSMYGEQDLNLIPVFLIDAIDINYSGASLAGGSGGFGGSLNLASTNTRQKNTVDVFSSYGSFGSYKEFSGFNYGHANWWGSSKIYFITAQNNFPYINTFKQGDPSEKEEDASMYQYGILQSFGWQISEKDILKANAWYQDSYRNLPQAMITSGNHEYQKDESLRSSVNYQHYEQGYILGIDGSFVKEYLFYHNLISDINEPSYNNRYELKANIIPRLNNATNLRGGIEDIVETADTKEYFGLKKRNRAGIWSDGSYNFTKKWQAGLVARAETIDFNPFQVAYTGSLAYKALGDERLVIHANGGHNFNYPNLNDLYWVPGGNPDLKPENTLFIEAGIASTFSIKGAYKIKSGLTLFSNWIDNYIQWAPTGSSYWQAQNLKKVWARGIETNIEITHQLKDGALSINLSYQYTPATDQTNAVAEQLIYHPLHTAQAAFRFEIKKFEFAAEYTFTGERNTTDIVLPYYNLVNVIAGRSFSIKKVQFILQAKCNNLFNESYQAIVWRPMPGRWFELNLKVKI